METLWRSMWDHVKTKKATRNDFMSHSSYQFRGVMAVMGAWSLFSGIDGVFVAGFIGGLIFGFAREEYDRRRGNGWDYYDILGSMWGLLEAEAIVGLIFWSIQHGGAE